MIRKTFFILCLIAFISCNVAQENSANLVSDTVEIPEMEAKVVIEYPKVISMSSWDGKYRPKVRFRVVYSNSKGRIFVSSSNISIHDYSEPGVKYRGTGLSGGVLRNGKTFMSTTWFDFKKPFRGKLYVNYEFFREEPSETPWIPLMVHPIEMEITY